VCLNPGRPRDGHGVLRAFGRVFMFEEGIHFFPRHELFGQFFEMGLRILGWRKTVVEKSAVATWALPSFRFRPAQRRVLLFQNIKNRIGKP